MQSEPERSDPDPRPLSVAPNDLARPLVVAIVEPNVFDALNADPDLDVHPNRYARYSEFLHGARSREVPLQHPNVVVVCSDALHDETISVDELLAMVRDVAVVVSWNGTDHHGAPEVAQPVTPNGLRRAIGQRIGRNLEPAAGGDQPLAPPEVLTPELPTPELPTPERSDALLSDPLVSDVSTARVSEPGAWPENGIANDEPSMGAMALPTASNFANPVTEFLGIEQFADTQHFVSVEQFAGNDAIATDADVAAADAPQFLGSSTRARSDWMINPRSDDSQTPPSALLGPFAASAPPAPLHAPSTPSAPAHTPDPPAAPPVAPSVPLTRPTGPRRPVAPKSTGRVERREKPSDTPDAPFWDRWGTHGADPKSAGSGVDDFADLASALEEPTQEDFGNWERRVFRSSDVPEEVTGEHQVIDPSARPFDLPPTAAELGGELFAPAFDRDRLPVQQAQILAVYSPKGGVGKTSIAVNMAARLAMRTKLQVCIVDLDLGFGNVGTRLGMFMPTVRELLAEGRIDHESVSRNLAYDSRTGLHALLAPLRPDVRADQRLIRPESFDQILRILADRFDVIILDCPVELTDPIVAQVVFRRAHRIAMVLNNEQATLIDARRAIETMCRPA
ncbi:MAG: AAA family ATPase, partial [Acidimicrobiia bacterium]